MKFFIISFLFSIFICAESICRVDSLKFTLEPVIDEYIENTSPQDDDRQLFDYYYQLSQEKLEINNAGLIDLMRIPFMDFNTAKTIIDYRKNTGYIFSYRELLAIKDADTASLKLCAPFITVNFISPDNSLDLYPDKVSVNLRSRFAVDLQERRGFLENKFEGSKFKSLQKIRFGFGKNYILSITAEKDPGEKSFTDHLAFNFNIKNIGVIENLIIGDYLLEYGQGLALGGNFPKYNSIDAVTNFNKNRNRMIPYSGTTENGFFRGAAGILSYANLSLSVFYSGNKFDASVDSSGIFSSASAAGLHRTEAELTDKNSVNENMSGLSIVYSTEIFDIGLLHYKSRLSAKPSANLSADFSITSLFYNLSINNFSLFGETSYDNKNIATINTLSFGVNKNISFLVSLRNYPAEFFSFHANSFGRNNAKNEFGIFTGIKLKTEIGVFNLSYDMNKAHTPGVYDLFPDKGTGMLFNYSTPAIFGAEIDFRYTLQNLENTIGGLTEKIKVNKFRLQVKNIRIADLTLKDAFYFNKYQLSNSPEDGFAFIQDITYDVSYCFFLTARFAVYSTDSYNTAIFAYENDLPGNMSSTALFDRGIRYYLIANYSPANSILFSFKYSVTQKSEKNVLGSGYNEISGNIDNKMTFQAILQL